MIELSGHSMGGKLALSIISEAKKDYEKSKHDQKYDFVIEGSSSQNEESYHLLDVIVKVKTHQSPLSYDIRYYGNVIFSVLGGLYTSLNDWFRGLYDWNLYDRLESDWDIATNYNKFLSGESFSASYAWWIKMLGYASIVAAFVLMMPQVAIFIGIGFISLITSGDLTLYTSTQKNNKLKNFKHVKNMTAGFDYAHSKFKPKRTSEL